jgi:hypothetical protein
MKSPASLATLIVIAAALGGAAQTQAPRAQAALHPKWSICMT